MLPDFVLRFQKRFFRAQNHALKSKQERKHLRVIVLTDSRNESERSLGPSHPDTLNAVNNFAVPDLRHCA